MPPTTSALSVALLAAISFSILAQQALAPDEITRREREAEQAQPKPNISAFDDDFVWHVSETLATQLILIHELAEPIDASYRSEMFADLSLIYHHKLIECDGPLQDIDPYVINFQRTECGGSGLDRVLASENSASREILSAIGKWNAKVIGDVIELYGSGKFSTKFPSCVVQGYALPEESQKL